MNKFLRKFLYGLIIWGIPFITSFFIWDPDLMGPTVSSEWFNAIMAFTWAIGFSIAAVMYFKDVKKNSAKEGWCTGIFWYIEMLILDFIFLVMIFKMSMPQFYPMFLTYLNAVFIAGAIGHIINKK